jgi:hypothetical protein
MAQINGSMDMNAIHMCKVQNVENEFSLPLTCCTETLFPLLMLKKAFHL